MTQNMDQIKSDAKLINIKRDAINWDQFSDRYKAKSQKDIPFLKQIAINTKKRWNRFSVISFVMSLFPITEWLPKYNIKTDLLADIMAGVTISVLHVPQAIGNSFLLELDPINGFYVSFFPVLIYSLMGTSRHISIGTFAVASLMMTNVMTKLGSVPQRSTNSTTNETLIDWPPTHMEVLNSICIVTGIIQIVMGFLSLGSLSLILSDEMVSSFTTGVAIHVVVSQLDTILGLNISNQSSGPFKLIRTLEAIRSDIHNYNLSTIILSLIVMAILMFFKDWAEPIIRRKTSLIIPIDFFVVICSTLISWLIKFNEKLDIQVVGKLSKGLPEPRIPRLDFIYNIVFDCFIIATVTFAISLSLAKLLAKKNRYEVIPNQELIAMGSGNVFSSFFAGFPSSAAMSRSTLQESIGGKTQMAGLFSCAVILCVLLWLAPFLYHLPQFVLSCIITIAIKSMFKHFRDFWEFWFISKLDASVWMVTFLSIILLDVDIGLIFGIIFSLHVILIRIIMPSSSQLGCLPSTELYVDINKYRNAEEIKGIKILRFCSPIFYLSKDIFKRKVLELALIQINDSESLTKHTIRPKTLIIDMSCVPFMDRSGVETIVDLIKQLEQNSISVGLVSCPIHVIEMFERSKFFQNVNKSCIYPTIHDAVITFK